jgi:hypothetical protein
MFITSFVGFAGLVICVFCVYYIIKLIVAIEFSRASLDVYALLSHEFQATEVVIRNVNSSPSPHIARLRKSLSLRFMMRKAKIDDENKWRAVVEAMIISLARAKMAEMMEIPFAQARDANHPIFRELTAEEVEEYIATDDMIFGTSLFQFDPETNTHAEATLREAVQNDFGRIKGMLAEFAGNNITCVKKLPQGRSRGFRSSLSAVSRIVAT